ncbi:class C beta-lactamase [Chryseobacterium limigenitum]|uniref:Beta-lactamase n=1 Tax=Chryseobacterium limigenitum TaxID=1612149 RepID=A0A1K2IIE5_9FLAO|nr:class C beta-lactamase [Chryseobacterium limigenitum]SFZ92008.1 beta-lactamase class C [Chryseobacterium limigenitum]
MYLKKILPSKTITVRITAFLISCTLLSLYRCKETEKTASTDIKNLIDSLAKPLMSENKIPGISIAITVNGKHSFFNYGTISKESNKPVTNQSLFELGSISKTFTVTLASLSQLNGNLDMSSPVSKYLPNLKNTVFDSVKLYHLGTHAAGGLPLQLPDNITNNDQLMNYYKTWTPLYAPGTKRVYSNPSIGLLGVIAGKTMNEPFTKAMEDNVFAKIGMNNTFYTVPQNKMSDYAQGYNKEDKPVRLNPGVLANEAYGIKSSTQDMLKFVDSNMGVGNLDPKLTKALQATHTGYFKTGQMTQDLIWEQYSYPTSLSQLLEGNADDMAYKANDIKALSPLLEPQSNVVINKTGSTNGFASYVIYIPSKKIGVVMLANKNYPIKARVENAYKILSYLENHKN